MKNVLRPSLTPSLTNDDCSLLFSSALAATTKRLTAAALSLAILMTFSLSLIGCGKFSPLPGQLAQAKADGTPALDPDDAYIQSQNLTDDGENLMQPDSFDQATDKFRQALEIDPSNFRAKFYSESMKPVFAVRGYFSRIRPFYMTLPDGVNRYTSVVDHALNGTESRFRHFLMDGPEDIHNLGEMQEYFDTVILSLENLRSFLRANKTQELRLRRIPAIFSTFNSTSEEESVAQCNNRKFGPLAVDLGFCGTNREVSLNRADFEVLQLAVAAYEGELTLLNAYSINPKLVAAVYDQNDLREAREARNRGNLSTNGQRLPPSDPNPVEMSREDRLNLTQKYLTLLTDAGFGHLRKTQKVSAFEDISQGVKIALFYYLDNQHELCKQGYATPRNRPGYLIETGLCHIPGANIPADNLDPAENIARILETALTGQPVTPALIHHSSRNPWSLNALGVLRAPPENLSFFKTPNSLSCPYSEIEVDDAQLSHYMLNGTATQMIEAGNPKCSEETSGVTK